MKNGELDGEYVKYDGRRVAFSGVYRKGKLDGCGVIHTHGNCRFAAYWKKNKLSGKCMYYYPNGISITCKYKADKFISGSYLSK